MLLKINHYPMKRLAGTLAMLMLSISQSQCDIMPYAYGKSGASLKNIIKIHSAPRSYNQQNRDHLVKLYTNEAGDITDGITGHRLSGQQYEIIRIIPDNWMVLSPTENTLCGMDMHSLIITDPTIAFDRESFPFGNVSEPVNSYGTATIGYTPFRDDLAMVLEPDRSRKGDIARSILYTATVYSIPMWSDWGSFFFQNNQYPTLTRDAIDCYLSWHRNDPVDSMELARNILTYTHQGNINPFIEDPSLIEYIWGDSIGIGYGEGRTDIVEPLRGTYFKSLDKTINLKSPYVPEDALWWIDGKQVSGAVELSSMTLGTHEMAYASGNTTGKLLITISE